MQKSNNEIKKTEKYKKIINYIFIYIYIWALSRALGPPGNPYLPANYIKTGVLSVNLGKFGGETILGTFGYKVEDGEEWGPKIETSRGYLPFGAGSFAKN